MSVHNLYHCYTDGSCRKSEGSPGGWGVYIRPTQGAAMELYGGEVKTNSTAMELRAVREALRYLPDGATAILYSDSKGTLHYCEKAIPLWKKNNWSRAPEAWLKLLQEIDDLWVTKNLNLSWKWIRSHQGNEGNEKADDLARKGAREAKQKITP